MPFLVASPPGWVYAAVTNSINCKVFATWGERRVREKKYGRESLLTRGKMKGNQVCWYIKRGKSLSLCAFLSQFIPLRWNIIKSGCAISRAGARACGSSRQALRPFLLWLLSRNTAKSSSADDATRLPLLCVFLIFRAPAAFIFNFTLKPLSGAINHSRRAKCRSNFKRLTQYLTQTLETVHSHCTTLAACKRKKAAEWMEKKTVNTYRNCQARKLPMENTHQNHRDPLLVLMIDDKLNLTS